MQIKSIEGAKVNFSTAVKKCMTQKYFIMSGRASRSEYWYFYLFFILISLLCTILGEVFSETISNILLAICYIILGIPGVTVASRRLHDIDKSAWFLLLSLIPIIGAIILIILFCKKGTYGINKFGKDTLSE